MITITCTHCQTALRLDDAYAGGVCRCQHCGTIQRVPSKSRLAKAADAAPPGLQQSSGPGDRPADRPATLASTPAKGRAALLAAGVAGAALVLILLLWMVVT